MTLTRPHPLLTRAAVAAALAGAMAWPVAQAQQPAAPAAPAASAPAHTVRAELAKPLNEAQELLRAGNAREALARVATAEAVGSLTPFERYMVDRVRGPAAAVAGENALAIQAFEASLDASFMPKADRLPITDTVARLVYQSKDYPRAVAWLRRYIAEGGTKQDLLDALPSALYLSDDHAGVIKELGPRVQADEAAGLATPDPMLRMLGSSQGKVGDDAGYLRTLERMAVLGGKPEVWGELIARTARAAKLGERYKIDLYRLKQATGSLNRGGEVIEMAWLALKDGLPAEADAVLKDGQARGLITDAEDVKQARDLAAQATKGIAADRKALADGEGPAQAAKDGNALANLGFALVSNGQADKGAGLMAQGVAKGGLRRPDETQLRLGIAQWRAGRADEAQKSFAAVKGAEGGPELARLWGAFVRSRAAAPAPRS